MSLPEKLGFAIDFWQLCRPFSAHYYADVALASSVDLTNVNTVGPTFLTAVVGCMLGDRLFCFFGRIQLRRRRGVLRSDHVTLLCGCNVLMTNIDLSSPL